jgi:CRISPR/Cas system-associated endonuclease/helicase Cas3
LVQNQDTASVTEGDNLIPFASPVSPLSRLTEPDNEFSETKGDTNGIQTGYPIPFVKPLSDISSSLKGDKRDTFAFASDNAESQMLSCTTKPAEFAEQIRKAIANFDRSLAIQIWDALKAKAKRELRAEVKSQLTAIENENFKLLVAAGFLQGMRVKYVGDSKYAEQYEGLELEVYSIDEYFQITCRKPNGAGYTTRLKPEELEIIS